MFRIDSKGEISPSSTLDLLPTSTASHVTRRRASSAHHTLEIRPNDGTVVAYGASALEEEGDNFLAHLGIGDEWGQRVFCTVAMVDRCKVLEQKTLAKDGYQAVRLACGFKTVKRFTKNELGKFIKAGFLAAQLSGHLGLNFTAAVWISQ